MCIWSAGISLTPPIEEGSQLISPFTICVIGIVLNTSFNAALAFLKESILLAASNSPLPVFSSLFKILSSFSSNWTSNVFKCALWFLIISGHSIWMLIDNVLLLFFNLVAFSNVVLPSATNLSVSLFCLARSFSIPSLSSGYNSDSFWSLTVNTLLLFNESLVNVKNVICWIISCISISGIVVDLNSDELSAWAFSISIIPFLA